MSCSYTAHAIIGLRIPVEKVYGTRTIKTFEHSFPEDWIKDPRTGKDLWRTETVLLKGFIADSSFDCRLVIRKDSYGVIVENIQEPRGPYAYICLSYTVANDYGNNRYRGHSSAMSLYENFDSFREVMQETEFWNDENFGLWSYLSVSC
jgi:hypothetical protein